MQCIFQAAFLLSLSSYGKRIRDSGKLAVTSKVGGGQDKIQMTHGHRSKVVVCGLSVSCFESKLVLKGQ